MTKHKTIKISTLGSQITSVISVALVLLILGILTSLGIAAGRVTNSVLGDVSVIVKMDIAASDADIQAVKSHLEKASYTQSLVFTSAEDVLKQEMEYNADILDMLEENPYSAEFEVKLVPQYVHPDSISGINNRLMLISGIDEVVSQADMVKSVTNVTHRATIILAIVAAVLLIISLVLIFNTVSIAVYGRRFIIRTMQLVGATSGFIRRPFLVAGIISGVLAGVISSIVLLAIRAYVSAQGAEVSQVLPYGAIVLVCVGMLSLGVIICGVASYVATNKYLRSSREALYS